MMVSGTWLRKLGAMQVTRPKFYDRLLQSGHRLKQAKAKTTTAAQRYKRKQKQKARHATRSEALSVLQEKSKLHNRRQVLASLFSRARAGPKGTLRTDIN